VFGKYRFTLGRLYKPVVGDKSKATITKSNRLIITLNKKSPEKWLSLNAQENRLQDDKPELDGDPEKGLMDMMKKLYDEGDDEMKRTMAKTWYESRHKMGGGDDMGFP